MSNQADGLEVQARPQTGDVPPGPRRATPPAGPQRWTKRTIGWVLAAIVVVVLAGVGVSAIRDRASDVPPTDGEASNDGNSGVADPVDEESSSVGPEANQPEPFLIDDARSSEPWHLTFNDEFDGDVVDDARWTDCYWWDRDGCSNEGNNELQWYLPGQRSVGDGLLKLEAVEDEIEGSNGVSYPYRSGMITTGRAVYELDAPLSFAFTYGYVEARVRPPSGQGLWPALWLLPVSHEERPEIDIFEVLGHEPDMVELHMHANGEDGERVSFGGSYAVDDNDDGWHIVAVDWRPGEVVWFVDGVERFRVDSLVPDEPMYVLANLAVGGDWPGAPDDSTSFPANYEIDYIRVWQQDLPAYTATGSMTS